MATLSSLQDRLQGLGSRLKAENDSQSRDRMNTNLTLDFSRERAGSERRPRPQPFADFQIPGRPNTISARPRGERPRIEPLFFQPPRQQQDSPELNAHVKEISRKNGLITLNGKQYKSTIEDMKYISELGNGTSGSVVKMVHKPSEKFIAVKQMHRSGNLEEAKRVFFDLEVVLKSHDCPYIVQCLGCFVTDTDVWICMELMATCLDKLMKKYKQPFPEPIIGRIAVGTVKALNYLKESHGVIHRDVKPSNILLDEKGNIKLCDFGISGRLVDSKANTRSAGCAAYMAPERIDPPDPSKPDYDIRADVWSLGITLVELATGQFPYKDCRTDFEVLTKVLQDAPPCLPPDKGFSQDFRDFVRDCLVKDYKHRPKYKKLLEYPFIRKYEKEKVDVSKWFIEVTRTIEDRSKTWPQTVFPSPHNVRNSRSNNRAPSSVPVNETPPTPPPVAPRRRSRTPDSRSQERFNHLSQLQGSQKSQITLQNNIASPPSPLICSSSNNISQKRPQVPASPILSRAISASPARSIPPASPILSRAFSSSPVPKTISSDAPLPHVSSHYLSTHLSSTIPSHQYGVPLASQPSTHYSYNAKPSSVSQAYSQYSNPYSSALPPRATHNSNTSSSTHGCSQSSNSGSFSTSLGENSIGTIKSISNRFQYFGSNGTKGSSGASGSDSYLSSSASAPSSTISATNSTTLTPQILRKTPEPVRYPTSYLPPHVSPLVSRRIVESRGGVGGLTEKNSHHLLSSSISGPSSLPTAFASPHYRYTQEAFYNSRPYYTPEPQRRIFPRAGNL